MPQVLSTYIDADWGNDINNHRSTTGYLIKLYDSQYHGVLENNKQLQSRQRKLST